MVFVPKFNARFIGPIRDNVLSYIQAHEVEALEWANDGPMIPSKVHRRSLWYNTLLPALSVVAVRTRIAQDEDDARLGETHEMIGRSTYNMASVTYRMGDHAKAQPLYEESVRLFSELVLARSGRTGEA